MGDPRHHNPLEISHNGFHRLARFWRGGGQGRGNLAFGRLGTHGAVADVLVIVRSPAGNMLAPVLEFVPVHSNILEWRRFKAR